MTNNEILNYITKSFELKEQGYYKQAIEMLYKALSVEQNNIEILSQLAELYFLLGNNERTLQYIEKTLDKNPKHLVCLNLLMQIHLKENNLQQAKEIAEKILEIDSNSKNLVEYVKILNALSDFESIKNFDTTSENVDEMVLLELADAYYKNQKTDMAINLLEKAVALDFENVNILSFLGKLYYKNYEWYKAKAVFTMLEEKEENDICMHYLGLFAMEEEKFNVAIDYFQKALRLNPKNAEYAFDLANAYYLNGWVDEAIRYFNESIIKDPDNIEYIYALAYLYYRSKDFDKTNYAISKILNKRPEYKPAKVLKSLVKLEMGDVLGAKEDLEILVDLESDDDFALFSLAKIYLELGFYDKAKVYMERALELKDDSLEYMCEYVHILIEEEDFEFAQKLLDKLLEINEKYYDTWVLQANLYYAKEDCIKLFDTAQKLIELDTNRYEGYYYNSLALSESDDIVFAIESLKKAISLEVNNAPLYVLMSEFYQALGQNENALLYLGEASNIDASAKNKELYSKLASIVRKERANS